MYCTGRHCISLSGIYSIWCTYTVKYNSRVSNGKVLRKIKHKNLKKFLLKNIKGGLVSGTCKMAAKVFKPPLIVMFSLFSLVFVLLFNSSSLPLLSLSSFPASHKSFYIVSFLTLSDSEGFFFSALILC
jgi:hypothetical protein